MGRITRPLLLAATGLLFAACGSDSTGTSGSVDLTGTWNATAATVTNISNTSQTDNLIADGATLKIVFGSNHSYTTTTTPPGQDPDMSSGTYTQSSTSLVLTDGSDQSVTTFNLSVSGTTMMLSNGVLNYDFGSGDVASHLSLTLKKQ